MIHVLRQKVQHPKIPEINADAVSRAKTPAMASESYDFSTPVHISSTHIYIYINCEEKWSCDSCPETQVRHPNIPETVDVMSRAKKQAMASDSYALSTPMHTPSIHIYISCKEKWSHDSCAETLVQHQKIPE